MFRLSRQLKPRVIVLCMCFFLALSFSKVALANTSADIPSPSELLYVTDTANALSPEVENYIVEQNNILYENTGAQIAVLTIDFIPEGYDSETYSYAVFDEWGIGSAEKNNGILILLVPGEGKFWITQGSGLMKSLTSGKLDKIINKYLADDFDAGKYDEAVTNTFNALLDEMDSIYGSSATQPQTTIPNGNNSNSTNNNYDNTYYERDNGSFFGDVVIPFGVFILVLVVTLRSSGVFGRSIRRNYGGYGAPPMPRPRPFYFPWWAHHHHHDNHRNDRNDRGPKGPMGGGPSGGSGNTGSRPSSFGGGSTRGGGAGRSSTSFGGGSRGSSSRGGGSFGGGSSRGGSSFGGGSRGSGGGSFGGGGSRGGGAGRK